MKRSYALGLFAALALLSGNAGAQQTIDEAPTLLPDEQLVPVADEEPEAGTEAPDDEQTVPEISDEERLNSEFERFKQLLQEGVFDEADSVAKRIIQLTIEISGPRSNDTAKALTNLAIVQHRTRQFDAARQNFEAAIEIIEENEDRLNGQLINPLKGLGAAQLEGGRPDLAAATYDRAVHLSHVNDGPHNLNQVEILEALAEVNLRMGTLDEARQIQDTIYGLSLRHHNGDLLELVPTLMRRAAWQHRAGFIYDERTTYRRIIRIIEDEAGKDDLRLVEPLLRLGQSFFYVDLSGTSPGYQQSTITSGEIYFKRAIRIAEESPESSWQAQANATLALADYYMFRGNEQRARNVYLDAWDLLSSDEERYDFRREALQRLIPLRQRPFPKYVGSSADSTPPTDADPLLEGEVKLTYVITARGRPGTLKVVEVRPEEFVGMLNSVQREMRRRVYRPIFEEGEAVDSPEQILSHRFFYRQADLDAARNAAADPAATDGADDGSEAEADEEAAEDDEPEES